jgi:hypothetical protein
MFHKMREISWEAEDLLGSQEGPLLHEVTYLDVYFLAITTHLLQPTVLPHYRLFNGTEELKKPANPDYVTCLRKSYSPEGYFFIKSGFRCTGYFFFCLFGNYHNFQCLVQCRATFVIQDTCKSLNILWGSQTNCGSESLILKESLLLIKCKGTEIAINWYIYCNKRKVSINYRTLKFYWRMKQYQFGACR